MKKGGDDEDDHKKEEARTETVVETPAPEPVWEEPAPAKNVSLEERVEALETKVEGEGEGEGFVTPRTGA